MFKIGRENSTWFHYASHFWNWCWFSKWTVYARFTSHITHCIFNLRLAAGWFALKKHCPSKWRSFSNKIFFTLFFRSLFLFQPFSVSLFDSFLLLAIFSIHATLHLGLTHSLIWVYLFISANGCSKRASLTRPYYLVKVEASVFTGLRMDLCVCVWNII